MASDLDESSVIPKRRMIRRYSDRDIGRDVVDSLLDAAIAAPSPHNRQPWRIAIITGPGRVALAKTMGDQLRDDLRSNGVPETEIEKDVGRSYFRITTAPVSLLMCLSMEHMDKFPDQRRTSAEHWMAGQAVAAAIQNVLLRATELGIGACWMCAPLFCQSLVREVLHLPMDWEPQALITLGYPLDAGRERTRRRREDVSRWFSG